MDALRPLVAILLSLSLFWASAQQALAHGQSEGVMQVTLCDASGQGQTLMLDAQGNRVSGHSCTDCLAAHAAAIPAPAPGLALPASASMALNLPQSFAGPTIAPLLPFQPRGPPAPV